MPYWFDGNNLIGLPSAATEGAAERRRAFLVHLSEIVDRRGGRFLVFFDGDDADRRNPPRGVNIRFSAPLSADDDIIRRLEGVVSPGEIIVVTNDRKLASRCVEAGGRTQSWSEFEGRVARRRPFPDSGRPGEKPEETVDVGEWLGFFGVDDENSTD